MIVYVRQPSLDPNALDVEARADRRVTTKTQTKHY